MEDEIAQAAAEAAAIAARYGPLAAKESRYNPCCQWIRSSQPPWQLLTSE